MTGYTDLTTLLDYMAAADLCFNLRYPTAGETSGSLIRTLGLGKAVVVSRVGSFAEIPDDCCIKVDLDEDEEEILFRVLSLMAGETALRLQIGENARRYVREHHRIEDSAAGYLAFIKHVMARAPVLAPATRCLQATILGEIACTLVDLGLGQEESSLLPEVASVLVELELASHAER